MRDGVVFYRSFVDAIRGLPPEEFKLCALAILDYGLDGKEPEGTGIDRTVFCMAKPQIDANNRRYENGTKGGRPITKANLEDIRKCQPEPFDGVLKGLTPEDYKFDELGYELAVSQKLTDKDGNGVTVTFKTVSYKNAIAFWEGNYYTTDQRKCVVMELPTAEQPATTEQPATANS